MCVRPVFASLLPLALVAACGGDSAPAEVMRGAEDPTVEPSPETARPAPVPPVDAAAPEAATTQLDLLFVIDNSLSMATEQVQLNAALPRLIRVLTSGDRTPELPADPANKDRYFTPFDSLHLGVVTSELGVMRAPLPGWASPAGLRACVDDAESDDGLLQTRTTVASMGEDAVVDGHTTRIQPDPACAEVDPKLDHLSFDAADQSDDQRADGAERTAFEFGCIAKVGIKGCAFEQQLEAMWKAVAPSTETDFVGTTARGHGAPDGANAGFVRDEALLAIVQITDEDDCSIKDGGQVIFETQHLMNDTSDDPWRKVPMNLRCGHAAETHHDKLQPAARYVEGLRSLKPGHPERVIFTGLVGIPEGLEPAVSDGRYEEVLAHPSMQFAPDEVRADLPRVSCSVQRPGAPIADVAFPPRRLVEVAAGLGPMSAALFSICRESYEAPFRQIIDRVVGENQRGRR